MDTTKKPREIEKPPSEPSPGNSVTIPAELPPYHNDEIPITIPAELPSYNSGERAR